MTLVDAVYINESGGKILLEIFIDNIIEMGIVNEFFFLFDERLSSGRLDLLSPGKFKIISSKEKGRRQIYRQLPPEVNTIVCFSNVPPPVKIHAKKVYIFFHNILLLTSKETGYSQTIKFKFFLKRVYIRFQNNKSYEWVAQTNNVKDMMIKKIKIKPQKIHLFPFFDIDEFCNINQHLKQNNTRFLYVADGSNQKNHINLLKSWQLINERTKSCPELNLTVPDKFKKIISEIDKVKREGCNIINHGYCSRKEICELYAECNYFIYPSLAESLGLPLIEAGVAGCEIIASDMPYVYDVIKPIKTFDPKNAISIANTVLGILDHPSGKGTEVKIRNEITSFIKLTV